MVSTPLFELRSFSVLMCFRAFENADLVVLIDVLNQYVVVLLDG